MKLIECVPNISEGRDRAVIDAVTREVSDTDGALLLDVDPGAATNRTVITFAGPPEAVAEAAFRVIRKAAELIDMAQHEGAHARMGATDVCPFVPMQGATMEDCIELAKLVNQAAGMSNPIFLESLAAAHAEVENWEKALRWQREAIKRYPQQPPGRTAEAQRRLASYESRTPWRLGT